MHALRIALEVEAEASLHGQKPGDRAAGVSTAVAPEAMKSLATRDLRIDRTPTKEQAAVRRHVGAACAAR